MSYLRFINPCLDSQNRREKGGSKSLSGSKILLGLSIPLFLGATALAAVAAPQQIAQSGTLISINRPNLKLGSKGESVSELQAALKLLGFYTGAVNGDYDKNTASAVSQFQRAAGLKPDGVVDAATWQKLFPSDSVVASSGSSAASASQFPVPSQTVRTTPATTTNQSEPRSSTSNRTPTPRRTATKPEPRPTTPQRSTNSQTTVVRRSSSTPGRSSQTTIVRQSSSAGTSQTPRSRSSSTSTQRTATGLQYTSSGLPILRLGNRGPEVVKLQQRLRRLGFLQSPIDGDFGVVTETAVKAFQKRFGLEADGVVGAATWEVLMRRRVN